MLKSARLFSLLKRNRKWTHSNMWESRIKHSNWVESRLFDECESVL